MSRRPRTPRYWPRMKVRGARRKRQREGVLEVLLVPDMEAFAKALDGFAARAMTTRETLADLGTSIMKEDHGSDI